MADAYAAYDVARLAMDGSNDSTTITDALGHTFTASGTSVLKTATQKYGTACAYFNSGSTDPIVSAYSTDWDMGAGDFCVDFFWKPHTSISGLLPFFQISTDGSVAQSAMSIGTLQGGTSQYTANVYISNVAYTCTAPINTAALNNWVHLAFFRYGTNIYLAVNGVVGAPTAVGSSALDMDGTEKLVLGGKVGNTQYGYMDCFRLTKGHSRYMGKHFIPPIDGNFNSLDAGVTTTNLGTNTRQVSCYGGVYNYDAIIAAIDAAVVALGWECYDAIYKGTVTRVYRKINKDANTYKYAILRIDKWRTRLYFNACESWSTATQTATNECWSNYGSHGQMGFALNNCDIIIFGNARYLGFMTYIQGSASHWAICVEAEREAAEDTYTAGYPCWGMIHSNSFGADTYNNINNHIAYPRTRDGATGQNAALSWGQNVSNFAFGNFGSYPKAPNYLQSSIINLWQHGWDTAKRIVSSVRHFRMLGTQPTWQMYNYGRLFGIKMTCPLGNLMDKISLPVDADGFYSSGGSETDHWILPSHSNFASNVLVGSGGTGPTTQSWTVGGYAAWCVTFDGRYAYLGTNANGVYKHDLQGGTGALVASTAGAIYDITTDGRYIYAGGVNGIYQIDTSNSDAVVNIALGVGGIGAIKYDGKQFLWAAQVNSSTQPLLYKIDTTSFAAGNMGTMTPSATTTAYLLRSMCTDGNDTMAWASGNSTTAADSKYGFITISTGATALSATINGTHRIHNQRAVSWSGTNWMYMNGEDAGTTQIFLTSGLTGTNVSSQMSQTSAHTSLGQQKSFMDRIGNQVFAWNPSSASGAACVVGGSNPDAGSATAWPQNMGTMSALPRCALHTGNSIVIQGYDNILYLATNMYQKSYNGIIQPQVLIPK